MFLRPVDANVASASRLLQGFPPQFTAFGALGLSGIWHESDATLFWDLDRTYNPKPCHAVEYVCINRQVLGVEKNASDVDIKKVGYWIGQSGNS